MENYIDIKNKEENHEKIYIDGINSTRDGLQNQIEQQKYKEEKQRKKLKFYKVQYAGFKVMERNFEEQKKELESKLKKLSKEHSELVENCDFFKEQNSTQRKRIDELNKDYEQMIEKMRVANLVRHDLEAKLKLQVDQVLKYYNELQENTKEMKTQKYTLYESQSNLKQMEEERNNLERKLGEMEMKMDAFSEKYETNQQTLKQLIENEKDSRENWKVRFEKEHNELVLQTKQMNITRSELQDQKLLTDTQK